MDLFMRIGVDGNRIRNNKVAFSNLSGIVWTGPNTHKKIHENGTFENALQSGTI